MVRAVKGVGKGQDELVDPPGALAAAEATAAQYKEQAEQEAKERQQEWEANEQLTELLVDTLSDAQREVRQLQVAPSTALRLCDGWCGS